MISTKRGIVQKINFTDGFIDIADIDTPGGIRRAVNYKNMTGDLNAGDEVIINTTAVELNLGTGGYDFVITNLSGGDMPLNRSGHIMKIRYTPMQINVLTCEENEEYHDIFNSFKSLNGMPVIIGELHSMLAPAAIAAKYIKNNVNVSYIMTDSAALPINFSNTVKKLKKDRIIDRTITMGNAFGGDLETVNIFTSLIAAKEIAKSDLSLVMMGPGITGTDTKYGFSGTDTGFAVDAANKLGGTPYFIPRIQFNDKRQRHIGISHHSITVLKDIMSTRCNLVIPKMDKGKLDFVNKQIEDNHINKLHNVIYEDGYFLENANNTYKYKFSTMGRDYDAEKEFFTSCAAAVKAALKTTREPCQKA